MLDKILSFIADSIKELKSDTDWKTLTRSTNWNGASDYCKYRKIGNVVEIRFNVIPKSNFDAANGLLLAYDMPNSIVPKSLTVRTVAYNRGNPYVAAVAYEGTENAGSIRLLGKEPLTQGYVLSGNIVYTV